MKPDQIKVGDRIRVKKESSHNLLDCHGVSRDLEFTGTVERINGQIIITDNPAMVNVKHVVEILK